MTLDLRASSRTGGWFAAGQTITTPGSGDPSTISTEVSARNLFRQLGPRAGPDDFCEGDNAADRVDYFVSELTLTRTLRADDDNADIELRNTNREWRRRSDRPLVGDGKIHVDVHVQFSP